MLNLTHDCFRAAFGRSQSGFTLAEVLISMVLIGVVVSFSVPKILQSFSAMETEDAVKEAFVSVGEAYLLRKEMSNQVGDEDIGGSERTTFRDFLDSHLNALEVDSSGDPAVLNATGHYILHRGVLVTRIQDDASTTPDTLQVSMVATRPDGSALNFQVYIPEGEERYTTKYGFTGNNADCTTADVYLNIVTACP